MVKRGYAPPKNYEPPTSAPVRAAQASAGGAGSSASGAALGGGHNRDWGYGPLDAHPSVYPQLRDDEVYPQVRMDPFAFAKGDQTGSHLNSMFRKWYGTDGMDPSMLTIVIHTGGVTRKGIPPHVPFDNVLYVGGSEREVGWLARYNVRDVKPPGNKYTDAATGMQYDQKCDGFNGFMCAELLRATNAINNPDTAFLGPELRRLLEDLGAIMGRAMDQAVKHACQGYPGFGHMGVLCRIGRHRSVEVLHSEGKLLHRHLELVRAQGFDSAPPTGPSLRQRVRHLLRQHVVVGVGALAHDRLDRGRESRGRARVLRAMHRALRVLERVTAVLLLRGDREGRRAVHFATVKGFQAG